MYYSNALYVETDYDYAVSPWAGVKARARSPPINTMSFLTQRISEIDPSKIPQKAVKEEIEDWVDWSEALYDDVQGELAVLPVVVTLDTELHEIPSVLEICDDVPVDQRVLDSPVIQALATVGLTSVLHTIEPRVCMLRRDFSDLSISDYMIDGDVVIDWDIPMLGADYLMPTHLTNFQVTGDSFVLCGPGSTSLTIDAVREKLDGYEAVQIVATGRSGRRYGILWCQDRLERIQASKSALYERVDIEGETVYYLLHGEPAANLLVRTHDWLSVTQENVRRLSAREGVILNCNSVEYRVRNTRVVTLKICSPEIGLDYNGVQYNLVGTPESVILGSFADVELQPNCVIYVRPRIDREHADSTGIVAKVRMCVIVQDIIPLLRGGQTTMRPKPAILPSCGRVSPSQYRLMLYEHSRWGPFEWTRPIRERSKIEYVSQVVHAVAQKYGCCTYRLLQTELRSRGLYSDSGRLRRVKYIVNKIVCYHRLYQKKRFVFSNVMLITTRKILRIKYSRVNYRLPMSHFSSFIHTINGVRYLLVYVSADTSVPVLAQYGTLAQDLEYNTLTM